MRGYCSWDGSGGDQVSSASEVAVSDIGKSRGSWVKVLVGIAGRLSRWKLGVWEYGRVWQERKQALVGTL